MRRAVAVSHVRVRVTLAAVLVSVVAGAIGSVVFVLLLRDNLQQALGTAASTQIDALATQLANGTTAAEVVVSDQRDVVVQVVDADGRVVASNHPDVDRALRTSPGRSNGVRTHGLRDSNVVVARRVAGGRLVVVGRSEEQVGEATNVTAALLAVAVPVGVAVIGGVVWLSVGRALRPVEAMRREAAALTSDRLDRRLRVPPGHDEIPRLSVTLNEMLDRIEASHRLQRQFVSDASHELRSPLATLRQLAEVARRHPDRVGVAELAGDVLAEEERMADLVAALLTLARPDAVATSTDLDLDDVVLEEVLPHRLRTAKTIDAAGVGPGRVAGDPVLFGQVVRNLLGNAVRHARSRVVVELGQRDGAVRLVVHDDGAGVPEAARSAVFERFVRLDEARARDAGGAGLGLAIVRKVVEGSGGTVAVDEGPLGGARFTVRLPAVEEDPVS